MSGETHAHGGEDGGGHPGEHHAADPSAEHGGDATHGLEAGHADHGHGHEDDGHGEEGHGEHWGDYNAEPERPSTLPPISGPALAVFALALLILLGTISYSSLFMHAAGLGQHDQGETAAQPQE